MDVPELHDEIRTVLGEETYSHCSGDEDLDHPGRIWENSIWIIETPIPDCSEIEDHLRWFNDFLSPHEEEIKNWIQQGVKIDLYFSYASDRNHCGFGLPPNLMEIFSNLGIRFEVSIMT